MYDSIQIGSTPCDEECAQVGEDGYSVKARAECQAFRNQLRRKFGPEPEGVSIRIKGNSHDFGTYYEVELSFDDSNEKACEYVYKVDKETPQFWDEQALTELGIDVEAYWKNYHSIYG